jgi:CheY-like chemotaxis protein
MKKLRILVVEDDLISQRVVKVMLEQAGYQVDIAQTGEQAIKLSCVIDYQLVFMDMGLPDMTGIDITRCLRRIEQEQHRLAIPIVALTAHGDTIKAQCLAAGMDDFMSKPLEIEQLKRMLEKWMRA